MSGRQLVQCLMLVADDRVGGAEIPSSSVYALLPKAFAEGRRGRGLLNFLRRREVQILDDENVFDLIRDVGRYRIVEIRFDGRPSEALLPLDVSTPADYVSLVENLLGLITVRVNDWFSYRRTRFAIDEHNSNILLQFVINRPDIPVSYSNNQSGSLLHMAAHIGCAYLAKLLLDHGAHINRTNDASIALTPLHVAVEACSFAVVKLLVERGADLNARRNLVRLAPLHLARRVDEAELLLRNGALVDCATNNENVTPLFKVLKTPGLYFEKNGVALVKLFLQYGAAFEMVNRAGKTRITVDAISRFYAHDEFMCVLENRFVDPAPLRQIMQLRIPDLDVSFVRMCLRHAVKVVCLHRSAVFDTTLDEHWCDEEKTLDEYRDDCETEIARLKSTLVPDTCISVHDILMSNERQVTRLLKNNSVAGMAATEDLIARFPIYGRILSYLLERARFRKQLHDEGRKNLESLSSAFKNLLEDNLKESILDLLVVADFINLRKACS